MSDPRPLALVTGGIRRLGAAIAARLAQAGYDLALVSAGGGVPEGDMGAAEVQVFARDLSDPDAAKSLIHDVTGEFGRVPDLLVNNAARFDYDEWHSMTAAGLEAHFRLNLFTPLLLSTALVEAACVMGAEAMQPAIVHIVDQRVRNPNGDQLSYTLSKQALAESIRTMALSFGDRARVNGVSPGLVIPTADYGAAQMAAARAAMPLGLLPDPADIAEAVLYLARARAVTGQLLAVDGGASLKQFDRDFVFMGKAP